MKKLPKALVTLFGVFFFCLIPFKTYALLIVDQTFTFNSFIGPAATVNLKAFDPGSAPAFQEVNPGANDFQYIYEVNVNPGFLLSKFKVFKPDFTSISDAFVISGAAASISSISVVFDFDPIGFDSPPLYAVITSPFSPNVVGGLLTSNLGQIGTEIIGPDDPVDAPVPTPEPGTLLLLGSGLLGLAGLGRKKFLRHVKKD